MNKTDKLLYGGFAVVIIGGIVAMLVSVFSPPKQTAEETAKTPKATVEKQSAKQIEDAPNQMEQWWQNVENARRQREVDEALANLIQAEKDAERAAQEELERAEKEWWESRQDWVDRFPFEPTPHPEITFDPTVYDPVNVEEWPEEKAELYSKMASIVDNHTFLKGFYKSKLPYTEEFEQMYDIVKEELGEELHPIPLAKAFETIKDYHKAAQRNPDSVYRKNARVRRPMPKQEPVIIAVKNLPPEAQTTFQNMTKQEQFKFMVETAEEIRRENNPHFDNPYEVRDLTWADRADKLKELILGAITDPPLRREDDSRLMSMEKATEIRDRLLSEIPAEGFLEMPETGFAYSEEYELKPGDPFLIR